jgi:hypothetical protein
MHIRALFALSLSALALPCLTQEAQDGPPITPYRPSVSSPAQLPAPGQLEMELGLLGSKSDEGRRNSLPLTFKLAFNPEWGVVLGGEALVSAPDGNGGRARGLGDTLLVLKRAFIIDDATAFGLELGAKLPTAKDSIGSGKADYDVNGIFSRDLGSVHMDTNLNFTRLGAYEPGSGRTQTGLSASFSTPVSEQWGLTWEWSGTRRRRADSTAQALLAASYSPGKRLTIDAGLAHGLNRATPDWSFFTGLVFPLAKLW